MACPYAELGLLFSAEPEVVRAAVRALTMKYHPDKGGSAARFRRIRMAQEAIEAGTDLPDPQPSTEGLSKGLRTVADLFRPKR